MKLEVETEIKQAIFVRFLTKPLRRQTIRPGFFPPKKSRFTAFLLGAGDNEPGL